MAESTTFMEFIGRPPAPPPANAPAPQAGVDVAKAWIDAITPKPDADPNAETQAGRVKASESWFDQFKKATP